MFPFIHVFIGDYTRMGLKSSVLQEHKHDNFSVFNFLSSDFYSRVILCKVEVSSLMVNTYEVRKIISTFNASIIVNLHLFGISWFQFVFF